MLVDSSRLRPLIVERYEGALATGVLHPLTIEVRLLEASGLDFVAWRLTHGDAEVFSAAGGGASPGATRTRRRVKPRLKPPRSEEVLQEAVKKIRKYGSELNDLARSRTQRYPDAYFSRLLPDCIRRRTPGDEDP